MDLEALAVMRADEQMGAAAWRVPDRDEPKTREPRACLRCGALEVKPWARFCRPCYEAGWRKGPCPDCGGPVNVRDRVRGSNGKRHAAGSAAATYWGRCSKCRGKHGRPPAERDEAWLIRQEEIKAKRRWMDARRYRRERAA